MEKTTDKPSVHSGMVKPVVMLPLKQSYEDENDLIDEFCDRNNCCVCAGSDQNGEANGYGCSEMFEWVEENSHRIKRCS